MDNHDRYLHGRVDPGVDSNISLVEQVERPERPRNQFLSPPRGENSGSNDHPAPVPTHPYKSPFFSLPSELVHQILSYLGPIDLASASSSCRLLDGLAKSDLCWQKHVQETVPGVELTSPHPFQSYRDLYIAHDPHWFLAKYKIWFCDYFLTGKIIICRFDPRRGCIEGYRLVAERPPPTFDPWEADDEVLIHSFAPTCRMHLDQPVVHLDAMSRESRMNATRPGPPSTARRFTAERPMCIPDHTRNGVFSNFLLARPVEAQPNMSVWPPETIPARSRVRNASQEASVGARHQPEKRSQASEQHFRIRRWMEMTNGPNVPGVHLGEEVHTYATLDPVLYTPTEDKPYRGIWVGDYSGHGCEFLLMNQPDDEVPFDESSVIQREDESPEEWQARKKEERVYRGKLEAIKLTGDPNVPRGEYTFVADDISRRGYVRTATEARFKGARVVRSRGHIAARMFRHDKYIESQLIMISHNRMAQYWVGFGHISFYERVDIEQFLSPMNDPPPKPVKVGDSAHL
ncbi:hypothetical protein BJ875DRAFT_503376 [Amylocarpus encephaloides]|uniref:F-box domain-containing protein n=1 Tax=Amylocarpus encephaloides TaxID=45428 RepID=A0A9P7YMW7_9HELO|nr:hypothetical protein BJ875DRAFT_503376 [Amylocarpus encephaloides]